MIIAISLYCLAIFSPKNISYLISWSGCLPGFSVKTCEMVDGASEVRGAPLLEAQGNLDKPPVQPLPLEGNSTIKRTPQTATIGESHLTLTYIHKYCKYSSYYLKKRHRDQDKQRAQSLGFHTVECHGQECFQQNPILSIRLRVPNQLLKDLKPESYFSGRFFFFLQRMNV